MDESTPTGILLGRLGVAEDAGVAMNANAPRRLPALLMMAMLLLMPLASSISVTSFTGGDAEAIVDVRDPATWMDLDDASVTLPAGETVTSASMTVGTAMAEHDAFVRIDTETLPKTWSPDANGQLTSFSAKSSFQFEEGSSATPVRLTSNGFLSDFEGTTKNFTDGTQPPMSPMAWSHGSISTSLGILPAGCKSGEMCWGTNPFDDDYRDDNNGNDFDSKLLSPAIFVDPALGGTTFRFASFHALNYLEQGTGGAQKYYRDCAYIEIRERNDEFFPPDTSGPNGFDYISIDQANSSNIGFGNGLYTKGNNQGQIQSGCQGVGSTQSALGGTSVTTNNPNGWADIAIDLSDYVGQWVQLRFVMEHNINGGNGNTPVNYTMPGWYIDNVRLGQLLPANGWMTVRGFLPSVNGGAPQPNGYGLLNMEAETTETGTLTVDVYNTQTGVLVNDLNGNPMSGLTGDIIELWDIDANVHKSLDFKFNYDSGPDRLSTAVLHGFNIGTRIGTGFNQTDLSNPEIYGGAWNSMAGPYAYQPMLVDTDFSPAIERVNFEHPITAIKPTVNRDCSESPDIQISTPEAELPDSVIVGQWNELSQPMFGFEALVGFNFDPANNFFDCRVSELWFDLRFGHHANDVRVDIANDGDIDWAFDQPGFGALGRQTMFYNAKIGDVHTGVDSKIMTLNLAAQAVGGGFVLPYGATVTAADIVFDQNTIFSTTDQGEGFDLSLAVGGLSEDLGPMPNASRIMLEIGGTPLGLADAINSLLSNPQVPFAFEDDYGNQWVSFRFELESLNASTGASLVVRNLDIVYDWERTFDENDGFDRELNQGVALAQGTGTADIPFAVHTSNGGAVRFADLSITTAAGYDSTMTVAGNPVGLYPSGDIYEVTTTHAVDGATGTTLAEAVLLLESSTGTVEVAWSEVTGFEKRADPDNYLTLETSTVVDMTSPVGKDITWRFRINPTWEDAETVRAYAFSVGANGVDGLPAAVLFDPAEGNAIENDAGLLSMQVLNANDEVQDLDDAVSTRYLTIDLSVRLQDLDVAPDPSTYNLVLEQQTVDNIDGNITLGWTEIDNISGPIGGDIAWPIDLGLGAAGDEILRVRMVGYEGGDTLCPSEEYRPDEDCAVPFNLSIDTYEPNLLSMSVFLGGADLPENWRRVYDDTWVVPSANQQMRLVAQDLPSPPDTMIMHLWVEYEHDTDGDGEADPQEYTMVTLNSDGGAPNASYVAQFNDQANQGRDPVGKVSVWIEGFDLAGNSIDGGSAGFENDYITYVSMSSSTPVINNVYIEDAEGLRFLRSTDPGYQGLQNKTVYAGNTYHVIVEAQDSNGWRDLDTIRVNLDGASSEDMVVTYHPRNGTAWTTSPYLTVVDNDELSPSLRRMDGGAIVDPFENTFYLDLPVRLAWGIPGHIGASTPKVSVQDFDNVVQNYLGLSGHLQDWMYADGLRLDFRADLNAGVMEIPYISDQTEPVTSDVQVGFVGPGDTVRFEGRYAYVSGLSNGVSIQPEIPLTMEITRQAAAKVSEPGKDYIPFAGEVWTETFTGGMFDFNITAPPVTNEFVYTFRLIDLPSGANDVTDAYCGDFDGYGCAEFTLKVDFNAPKVASNSWELTKGGTEDALGEELPSSVLHCVDAVVTIEEPEKLLQEEVEIRWQFYSDPSTGLTWPVYGQAFGAGPLSTQVNLVKGVGEYYASVDCIDLWPDPVEPSATQMAGVRVIFWVYGTDSAGSSILGGGPTSEGNVVPINGNSDEATSQYNLINEEAVFGIGTVRFDPAQPEVGQQMNLEVYLQNTGSLAGTVDLRVMGVYDGVASRETVHTSQELAVGATAWESITLESFLTPTTGLYYLIYDDVTGELLYNGSDTAGGLINVKVQSDSGQDGAMALLLVGLVGVVAVLATLVMVLLRRGGGGSNLGDDDDEYEEYEDEKEVVNIPSSAPAADVSPQMAEAMKTFPQWNQEQIQGYFDQGWDIPSLLEWVNSQE